MAKWDPFLSKCAEMCLGKCAEIGCSRLGYVFHCNKNIQKLKNEKENLENERTRINIMVESEKRNAKIILPDVENWQTSVEKMKEEIDEFLRDEQRKNMRCIKCGCPNIRWRYRLGKKSKSMTESVTSLKDEGIRLTGLPVAHSPPPPEIPSAHEHWKSRDHIFKEIMEALKDPHFKLIGVHGAGGVGKTTMVEEAKKKAEEEKLFDDIATAQISQTMDKKRVRGDLASDLGLKLEGSENNQTKQLWSRLDNEKKNLIILDDVWEPLDLADIGIPVIDGCKVVVTSREKDVFGKIMRKSVNHVDPTRVKEFQIDVLKEEARTQFMETAVKEFRIDVLKEEEAWTLFMKTAEISDNSEMRPEADELCRKCGGLPVAILAVAGALRDKDMDSWKDAVKQRKNYKLNNIVGIDPELFSSLRLSYDFLKPKDAQSCFLLCSLFPEDAKISIDDLVRYSFGMKLLNGNLDTLRNRVLTLVKRLQKDYLLLDGGDENVVSMHDVIRDVAISIAKKDRGYLVEHNLEKWPEKINNESYLAISLRSQNFHGLPNELEGKQLHTNEISDNSEMFPEADVLCRECRGLPVAILAVAGALRGKERYSWKDAVERLKNSELDGIVENTQPGKDAQSCFLLCSLFPEDAKISIGDLVRYSFGMRLLDEDLDTLENVRYRVRTLVKRLQESYLLLDGGDENVVSMHDIIREVAISIAKEERGYHYLVKHNLEKWPERRNYESYSAISFRSENFHGLPDELECKQLHTIVLKCNKRWYTTVPNNFFKGLENSLEVLDLSEMPMKSPPPSIAKLVKLRMLSLNGLTRDIALLGRLESLEILILHGITELAPEISHLTRLRLLDLSNCHYLSVIPPNVISELQNLEELYISDEFDGWDVEATNQERRNAKVDELNSLVHLTALQVSIPETSLTLLSDSWSSKLERFRIWIGTSWVTRDYVKYSSRRILGLSNIITLEEKFKVLINKVEELYLNKLKDLREVCHDIDGKVFPELKVLRIENCNFVEHILGRLIMFQPTPRQQGSFGNLSSLTVWDCNKVKYLFSLSVARCLVKLQKL